MKSLAICQAFFVVIQPLKCIFADYFKITLK